MTGPSAGSIIANEQALEKHFRAGYSRWLEEAKKRLGPDAVHAAPRVVSKAFSLAWNDRQRLRDQSELDAYLGANIQHGAARELSKRAGAERIKAMGGGKPSHEEKELTVDEAWTRLQQAMTNTVAPEAQRKRASTARHEAAGHMADLGREKFNWKQIGIVVGITAVIAIGGFAYVKKTGEEREIVRSLASADARPYETSYGQVANVTLDDSTLVRIGPDTRLTVPKLFGLGLRVVAVDGAADLNVRQTLEQPFQVRVGGLKITANGTEFAVRKFRDDANIVISARKGTLGLKLGDQERQVTEGMSIQVSPEGVMDVPSNEALTEATAWVDGNINIMGRPLKSALPELRRWFGLNIKVADSSLLTRPVNISAPMGSQKSAIASVEQSGSLKFTYVNETMTFQDAPAKATKTATKAPARGTKGASKRP